MSNINSGSAFDEGSRVPEPKPLDEPPAMHYRRAYGYVFDSPNWTMNVLFGFLCQASAMIVPVVGPLLFMGYQFEIVEALHRGRGRTYPDFDINRFADYLLRGLWPFLVSLVVMLVFMPVLFVVSYGSIIALALTAASVGDTGAILVVVIGGPLVLLLNVALGLLLNVVLTPLMLRAGLSQDFAAAFNLGWVKDFLGRVWRELILVGLFLVLSSLLMMFAGVLLCCIGSFAALALVTLAQAHLFYQLYALFLARGGEPIPLKPPAIGKA